ncbi:hypothetical protein PQX77_016270 [Marasmius sp. AFHP31]|nr:hypothetical protein PQX77_016270 [Marasmius sp. AFHP31]
MDPGGDLQLNSTSKLAPPNEQSCSDFLNAAAPALQLYLEEQKRFVHENDSQEERVARRREFVIAVWMPWSAIWEGNTDLANRKVTKKQWAWLRQLLLDLKYELQAHMLHVQLGHKDPDYVASIRPPAPPPSPIDVARSITWEEALEYFSNWDPATGHEEERLQREHSLESDGWQFMFQ